MYTGSVIRRPGDIHRTRWMAKCIYSLKVELLHEANKAELATLTLFSVSPLLTDEDKALLMANMTATEK